MWIPQKKELKAIRINKSLNSFDNPRNYLIKAETFSPDLVLVG